jgi:LPXTG-site transpeptidase (sortase) family protein
MNQIIFLVSKKKKRILKFQLVISILLFFLFFCYQLYLSYIRNRKENFSKYLVQRTSITNLYPSNNKIIISNNPSSIIGTIKIEKLQLNYPIFSYFSDNLLEIAPCRFYGPSPGNPGNLCIVAHNYNDYKFFSRINLLNYGDVIKIYDLNGNYVNYYVYNIYETNSNDISCTNQNTNGKKEITLITCNNFNKNRIIVKAKEG